MNPYNPYAAPTQPVQARAGLDASFMRKVYGYMAAGLGATGVTALVVASSQTLIQLIFGNPIVFYALLGAEVIMVIAFSARAARMSAAAAATLFFSYAVLNGVTLACIFLVYTSSSIASTFFITGGTFGAMSAYGALTKRDLTGLGHFAIMGLIGFVIASLVNIFLGSPMIYWLTTFMGVIVFVALTAYDTQKIRALSANGDGSAEGVQKLALIGALILYLDFINLFLLLLRLFGRRR
jgi:FtsH-binding integral membrane protein